MLGLRARASRNPILAISSPLNARSTLDNSTAASQSPLSCNLWTTCTLIRAQLFTLFTTFTCSNYPLLPRFKSNTTTLALTTTVASTRASTFTTTTALTFEPAATNHALRPLLPLPFTIGRFAHACIKTTTTTVQAKAKAAVRATVRTSSPTHFFVRVSTYLSNCKPNRFAPTTIAAVAAPIVPARRFPWSTFPQYHPLNLPSNPATNSIAPFAVDIAAVVSAAAA
ncbi:hypothetical protein BDP67DRAFT_2786 [Colletotrichum lupini]|nr:hypothetical protein BDP67DRAFT_2786 [Colletotrichum lupini]